MRKWFSGLDWQACFLATATCRPDPRVLPAYPVSLATWGLSVSSHSFHCCFRVQFYTLPRESAITYSRVLFVRLDNDLF